MKFGLGPILFGTFKVLMVVDIPKLPMSFFNMEGGAPFARRRFSCDPVKKTLKKYFYSS